MILSKHRAKLILLSSLCDCRHLCYNLQSQRGQDQSSKSSGSKAGPNTESVPDHDQDITTTLKTGNKQMKLVSEKSLGLDQAILHSINCCRKWSNRLLEFVSFLKCILKCKFSWLPRKSRLDFRRSLVSLLPLLRGRSAGSFPEQRLVIEPSGSLIFCRQKSAGKNVKQVSVGAWLSRRVILRSHVHGPPVTCDTFFFAFFSRIFEQNKNCSQSEFSVVWWFVGTQANDKKFREFSQQESNLWISYN